MKKIFSRVAHVFKHDSGDEQQDPGDASPPSPAVGDPGEHASLTSVDSGVLVDVSEPERSPTGAGAGAEAEAEAEPVAPVTDRARECAKPAAGDGADRAACSEAEVTEADRTTQIAAGQITAGEEQQLEMVEAAGDSEREQETPSDAVNEQGLLYEAVQKQESTAGIVDVEQVSVAAREELAAVTVPERQETEGPSEVQRAGPGFVQEQATPTQEQDPVAGVKQKPQEAVLSSQQQDPVSESVEEQQKQELVEELTEAPAAVERPATEPSGDLQSGTGAAAVAVGAADSAGPDHSGLPGTAAVELAPSSRQELPVEADSAKGGQNQNDSCVETNRNVTVEGMPVETVESALVSPADRVELDVTADGSDKVTVPDEPSAMDAEGVDRASEEPAATGDPPVTDSDGVLLGTGTEDTADDLDGKPKDKKKKRKKKRKNKSEQSAPVSLVAETLVKDVGEDKAKPAPSDKTGEKPTDSVKKTMAKPSGQTVGSDAADSKANKTKTKVSSSLTAGTRASTAKAKMSTASQAVKKPVAAAAQRDGTAKTKTALAKQSTTEASGSRSATPTRPLQNPAKARLKTQLRKETSVESNASTSSRGSSGARSARSGKRSSAPGTTPADHSGARANSAARRDSLPLSVSSGSTTVSTRGEDASSGRARTKGAKQQVDKSTPTARSSTPTTKKNSDAVSATKSPADRKTSAVSQTGNAKKEKKTKAPVPKNKKASGPKKTVTVTKGSDAKSASAARIPGATGTKTKALDVTGSSDAVEGKESTDVTAQPVGDHSLPSHQTATESSARGSPERPPLLEQDTLEDTSVLRPPLTQYDTVQDSTERPPLSEQEAVEAPRPPLTQHDTIDDPVDRPTLSQQVTLEDTSVLRPPTVQHDTVHGASPDRPPLVQQETIDLSAAVITSPSSEQPAASCYSPVGQPSSVATQSTPVMAGTAVPQVTLSPSSAAAPTLPSTAAVPTLPSGPSAAASDGSSRRSSMDVLDGPPRLRRSISGHGEQPGAARPDAVLEAMSQVHADSEARLAARRQARAEAREIRMRELERQQREAEQNGEKPDDFSDVSPRPAPSVVSSRATRGTSGASTGRRGSEDSAEDGASTSSGGFHLRDVRHDLRELEEKLRKTMVTSAQLDNDKSTLSYQVELLKDKLEEMQEAHTQLQREHRTRCSEHEQLKRVSNRLKEDYECCKTLLEERDKLIAENGLVLVGDEEDSESESAAGAQRPQKALVSQNAAQLLDKAGGGTLDSRLRRLGEEKNELEDQLRRLKLELEEERHMSARARISGSGAGAESDQVQREVARQVGEYRFKLQKADQDITNLQTAVQRLENQVARYKAAAETAEKSEEELKGEKRKLQRELRESLTRVDELETTNSHLQKRLDKLKNARSALLKDLSTE